MSLLPVATVVLGAYLKNTAQQGWTWPRIVVPFGILLLSGSIAYFSIIKPFREIEPAVLTVMDSLGEAGMQLGNTDGIQPRLNVLIAYRPLWSLYCTQRLRIVWSLGMDSQPDVGISFPTSKGVAGQVYQSKKPTLVNIEETGNERWRFTPNEVAKFQLDKLTAIYSWPIYEIGKHNRQTGRVIGTLNLDARTPGAAGVIESKHQQYSEFLETFGALMSKLSS